MNNKLLGWLLREYIVKDFLTHAKTTLVLSWRGVFIQKYFGLVGLFMILGVLLLYESGRWKSVLLLMTVPPLLLLVFQAAVSLNIPRYNLAFVLPMSLAMSMVLHSVYSLLRRQDKGNE